MINPQNPPEESLHCENDPDGELLTAFLDNELSDTEKAETEKRLNTDIHLRERLEKLRTAGNFLDSLEIASPNKEMTTKTMELLTGIVQRELRKSEKRRRLQNLVLISLFLPAAAGVFFLVSRSLQKPAVTIPANDTDYQVIAHLDGLEGIESVEFLRKLQEIPFFSGSEDFPPGTPPFPPVNHRPPFPPEKIFSNIFLKRARFSSFSEEDKNKYRNLWEEIESDPSRDQLEIVLERFSNWFSFLRKSDRYHFISKSEKERLAFIKVFTDKNSDFPNPYMSAQPDSQGTPPSCDGRFGRDRRFAGQNPLNLKLALPKEVRNEKLDIQEDFDQFVESLWTDESSNEWFSEKPKRAVIEEFIKSKGTNFFLGKLSGEGKDFTETLPDSQKERLIAHLILISLFRNERENNPHPNHPEMGQKPFMPEAPPVPRPPHTVQMGQFWKTESTADLAETLRRLPDGTREELLNLPADEMYSQLLFLHWGFDPKFGSPPDRFSGPRQEPPEKEETKD